MTGPPEEILKAVIRLLETTGAKLPPELEEFLQTPSIPANTYNNKLTPLETTTQYLKEKGHNNTTISKLLQRPTSTINNAQKNAETKNIELQPNEKSPYRIPTTAFLTKLSPAQSITHYLSTYYQLPNHTISKLLGRDRRNIHTTLQQAKKKLGGETK